MHILSTIFPAPSSTSGFSMIVWWIWMSHDVIKCHEMELNVIRFDQMSGYVIDCEFITMVTERNQTSHHSTSHHIKSHAWANLVLHLFVSAERRCLRLSSLRYRCSTRIALSSDLMWCDVEWCMWSDVSWNDSAMELNVTWCHETSSKGVECDKYFVTIKWHYATF
jgi:hypothetical protein